MNSWVPLMEGTNATPRSLLVLVTPSSTVSFSPCLPPLMRHAVHVAESVQLHRAPVGAGLDDARLVVLQRVEIAAARRHILEDPILDDRLARRGLGLQQPASAVTLMLSVCVPEVRTTSTASLSADKQRRCRRGRTS